MKDYHTFQLQKNSLVMHLKYGIGKYQGISTITCNNIPSEYLTLLYAENAKLYVPISQIYLISRYHNYDYDENVHLNKLGCSKWKNERDKIFNKINDLAVKILDSHAQRALNPGFSFHNNLEKYKIFCHDFPFQMTRDQNIVINEVLSDMSKKTPMNRLICGDVGFGKTEIAIRASFVAVNNQKQVIILVPTTLLAQQHYKNFKNRFLKYNIKVDILSRFQSKNEQLNCIKNMSKGYTNIIIGTHKILFNTLKCYDLGLLIIDEEHRFGVSQKEKIKKIFPNIDILMLTATPIPRTLNMSKYGIYDLSILLTPPKNRLPIKTFIKNKSNMLIRKIILFEISRNGQIYYICNKIQNLEKKLQKLKKLVPESKFKIGHGQMNGKVLKNIMQDFYEKKFDVLICTTIIETGIDIPTVNSIIIEHANFFGLAQLHQMRGRVGRSEIQSYAWLLISKKNKMSLHNKKRLKIIESIKDFKSGLELSKHDLKIRGVGEIFGKHQSGHMKNVTLLLYKQLIHKTIKYIKNNKRLSLETLKNQQPKIKLFIPTIIPNKYITDINTRLFFYTKIFSVNTEENLLKIKKQLIHKFGPIPIEVENLISKIKIKFLLNNIGIINLQSDKNGGQIKFSKINKFINIHKFIKICETEFKKWKISNQYILNYLYYISDDNKRILWILNFLKKLNNNT
ncbi:DEAD/DEAH box helicase [Buchnera aphidicola]|uniref:DEAD/DEAH box helicase n=1 Tax=Buchnera aphidicola TaxID=9 RepID=UPI003463C80D